MDKKLASANDKDLIIKRLNRIEGQVKGIQKMVEDERYCVANSIKEGDVEKSDEPISELMQTINKFTK